MYSFPLYVGKIKYSRYDTTDCTNNSVECDLYKETALKFHLALHSRYVMEYQYQFSN
jgi:hypothetical protein